MKGVRRHSSKGLVIAGIGGVVASRLKAGSLDKQTKEIEERSLKAYSEQEDRNIALLKQFGRMKISTCTIEIDNFMKYYSLIDNIDIESSSIKKQGSQETTREIVLKIDAMVKRAKEDSNENESALYLWATHEKLDSNKKGNMEKAICPNSLVSSLFMWDLINQANERLENAKEMETLSKEQIKELKWIYKAVERLLQVLEKQKRLIDCANTELKVILKKSNDWKTFSEEDRKTVVNMLKAVLRAQEIIELPLVDRNGKLSEMAMDFIENEDPYFFVTKE